MSTRLATYLEKLADVRQQVKDSNPFYKRENSFPYLSLKVKICKQFILIPHHK